MIRKYLLKESGFTLLELLATVAISSILIVVIYGVFISSENDKNKTQSHINLRQEANIIITQMRQKHQGEKYNLCYDYILSNKNISLSVVKLDHSIMTKGECKTIDPEQDLNVEFTLADQEHNTFDLNTVIEAKRKSNSSIDITIERPAGFYNFLKAENIFMYGSQFVFNGNQTNGPYATMVINGNLTGNQLNGGSFSNVSNIFFDGYVDIDGGSAGLGSSTNPGTISVNGRLNLWNGKRHIYGNVYVNGNLKLKDAIIHGNVYVNGDVELGWTPQIVGDARIYYTGSLNYPRGYSQSILSKVINQSTVEISNKQFDEIPPLKTSIWYMDNGYSNTIQSNNMKVYGNNIIVRAYTNSSGKYVDTFNNAIIVSSGDIIIGDNTWIQKMTGVLFAPNGKVTFNGGAFEGIVIAKNGFYVTSGGTNLEFKNIDQYIKNETEFPLQ